MLRAFCLNALLPRSTSTTLFRSRSASDDMGPPSGRSRKRRNSLLPGRLVAQAGRRDAKLLVSATVHDGGAVRLAACRGPARVADTAIKEPAASAAGSITS